jgi:hypothetical protein
MLCNAQSSCDGMHSCAGQKSQPDNSVGMDKKRKDLIEHGKSKEAFKHNIATEIKAGKKPSQALAIAYSEKNRKDILPTKSYKNTLQSYGLSYLKNNNGAVTSPEEAKQLASQNSGQSENRDPKDFKITQSDRKNADRFGRSK